MTDKDDDHRAADLLRRALAAHAKSGNAKLIADPVDSGLRTLNGHDYVVLVHNEVSKLTGEKWAIAVYRVRNDGMLKIMKRWPQGLDNRPAAARSLMNSMNQIESLQRQYDKLRG